ncbi:hypothetical protein UCRPC4_g06663 [Phaeomoniella chlamydospora]|uniref:Arylsulfotransferase n=1 Tax=Phaeomoniella chlamydospora TaxID=158046 RepID=A0A0G2GBW9_PHACM|nr:hypothetical protein UCRPC4_g06663 [Phaeomoniella chlamydospora]
MFTTENGTQRLSFIVAPDTRGLDSDKRGLGWILDDKYERVKQVHMPKKFPKFNLHEFNVIENGSTALVVSSSFTDTDVTSLHQSSEKGWITDDGFQEIDIESGKVNFGWSSVDHIDINRSVTPAPKMPGKSPGWDFIHLNSVDKNSEGDYLVSGRHTCAIYKVSGKTGKIMWQLGGEASSFKMINFTFSWQHDARWRFENETVALISFLDNGGTPFKWPATAKFSSGKLVKLDMTTMEATLVQSWDRPDGRRTNKRGNVQFIGENVFISWSASSYLSEFSSDGELVLEAQFASDRFATYRSYKFNFTGRPTEPPALKSFAFGTSPSGKTTSTVSYVSWNGATEVRYWNFYGKTKDADDKEEYKFIGSTKKLGFETQFIVDGYIRHVMVEGVSVTGESLGNSSLETTIIPPQWLSQHSTSDNATDDGEAELISSSSASLTSLTSETVDDLKSESQHKFAALNKLSEQVSDLEESTNLTLTKTVTQLHTLSTILIILFVLVVMAALVICCAGAFTFCLRRQHGRGCNLLTRRRRNEEKQTRRSGYEPVIEDGGSEFDSEEDGDGDGEGRSKIPAEKDEYLTFPETQMLDTCDLGHRYLVENIALRSGLHRS